MTTYTQILYHIVFSTQLRRRTLKNAENRQKLFKYWSGIISKRKSKAIIINGVEDHVHLLVNLNPATSLSSLVKEIKNAGTTFIKEEKLFPSFNHWQNGYGAFTCSNRALPRVVAYIKNQEAHHAAKTSKVELRVMLKENEIEYDEKYFE